MKRKGGSRLAQLKPDEFLLARADARLRERARLGRKALEDGRPREDAEILVLSVVVWPEPHDPDYALLEAAAAGVARAARDCAPRAASRVPLKA